MLIGRSTEYAQLRQMLQSASRVTLTGPGGVGKSALAGEFACSAADAGRRVIRLDLTDSAAPGAADALPDALEQALLPPGACSSSGIRPGERPLLLVESCEAAPRACADALARFARPAPDGSGPQMLASSRCPLPGSLNLHLGPLERADALELFRRHAARYGTDVTASSASRALADEVCDLLECQPLALVLAAAQLRAIPLHALPARLMNDEDCLAMAAERADLPRLRPARHRTLRCCLAWSHRLCTADEQLLWARLSVFPHAFTAAAAWRTCADERLELGPLRTALAGLHRQSLVETHLDRRPGTWYRMPRTTRAYGGEQLLRLGEAGELRRRCHRWSLDAKDLAPE